KNLMNVCKAGTDDEHPLGSSSIYSGCNPINDTASSPYGLNSFTNFPDIIGKYLNIKHIDTTTICHPYLIDFPAPYDKQRSLVNEQIVTKPSGCQCDQINAYKTEYNNLSNKSFANFSEYLEKKRGTIISQSDLDLLASLCNN